MSALSAYLAKNYLNASTSADISDPNSRPKKRRKKAKESEGTLLIADDEDLLLSRNSKINPGDNDDDGDVPMFDQSVRSAEFRKSKKNLWKSVDGSMREDEDGNKDRDNDGEADQILQDAAADSERRRQDLEIEDAPAVVDDAGPRMQSGAKAGLQTAADVARMIEKEEAEEERRQKKAKGRHKNKNGEEDEPETIYRDATGRRIDVSMKRAEARAAEVEAAKKAKKDREDAMGDVHRRMKEERKQELEDARFLTIGRSADDEEMNDHLRDVVRWDDPMAAYMANKQLEDGGSAGKGRDKTAKNAGAKAVLKKKTYQGHAAPNRYGILPGWRWDGVDRGNGFEKDWFQARGRKARNENLEYQWQMDE